MSKAETKKKNLEQKKEHNKGLNSFLSAFKDDRFKFIVGILFLVFSVFLTISIISYLFTWKIDNSKLDINFLDYFFNSEILVDNWTGKLGAYFSYKFIHDWFGVSSFLFVVIFFLIGLKMFNISITPVARTVRNILFLIIWLSILLSLFFGDSYFGFGGKHGFYISKWLNSVIGLSGSFAFLFVTMIAFLTLTIKDFVPKIKNYIKNLFKKEDINQIDSSNLENENNSIEELDKKDDLIEDEEKIENNHEDEEDIIDEGDNFIEEFVDEEKKISLESSVLKSEDGDIELTVEKIQEELVDENSNLSPSGNYDPTLDLSHYKFPTIDLLEDYKSNNSDVNEQELTDNKNKILETLRNYKIEIDKIKATIGPTVTLYEIVPAPGVRISKIKNLEDDIALSLAALGIRIIAPIPGKGTIGIEVPNQKPEIVSMRSVISSKKFQESTMELPIVLGKTISNETYVFDLTKMPHLLVAGATGQGKSVGLNAILASLLYKKHPSQLKFVLVDPKKVELTLYSKLEKHFLAKIPDAEETIITDTQKVVNTLNSLTIEMDSRYDLLKSASAKTIVEYNDKFISRKLNPNNGHKFLPYIVVVIDEFADLIMTAGKEVETPIARIAQLARAVGIHLIIATQRPSTNIITGIIKANFPARIAFRVTSMIDSRTILDSPGANQLIGRGDMLISQGGNMVRVQCAFIDTHEIERVTDYISVQQSYMSAFMLPEYVSDSEKSSVDVDLGKRDDLFDEAARLIVTHQQGSTSLIQRKFAIGYNRAGRIIDQLEAAGIVGPYEGSKARQVFYTDLNSLEQYLNTLN